jgi:AbrB family looped-hinge helix DNA binding protein
VVQLSAPLYNCKYVGLENNSMADSRISAKGQITLPRKVRQALNVKPGDRVLFLIEPEAVRLQALAASSARALAGSLRHYAQGRPSGAARAAAHTEVARAAAKES